MEALLLNDAIDCVVTWVESKSTFMAALSKGNIDLIISDYTLPGFNGLAALKIASETAPEIPFILFSGTLGEEAAIDSLRNGATDYVLKHRFKRLVPAVRRALIEAQERRKQRLVEETLRLRNCAIEASINAIVITSSTQPDDPIEYVNPAFERVTGYAAAEVMGRNCRFLQGNHPDPSEIASIRAILREQREGQAVVKNYRKDGSLFWNELHLAPVRDAEGHTTHFVGVLNDITETKRYQEQLEHQAKYDFLTDLPNRNLLYDRLEQAMIYAQIYQLDQSFVQEIPTNSDDTVIVKAVISLGHSLNIDVIAEGVESQAQLEFLHAHNCDEVQGYYFSKPVLPEQFVEAITGSGCNGAA